MKLKIDGGNNAIGATPAAILSKPEAIKVDGFGARPPDPFDLIFGGVRVTDSFHLGSARVTETLCLRPLGGAKPDVMAKG
mmetsp:Transcript_11643/g.22035  ORF Transcript_11643/g.22035 Transcript_11643/m.22035 type:complete len:80 (+) Transcript_11643:1676-1915(+)